MKSAFGGRRNNLTTKYTKNTKDIVLVLEKNKLEGLEVSRLRRKIKIKVKVKAKAERKRKKRFINHEKLSAA